MALQERSVNVQWPQRLKKGPKIKPLENRIYTPRIKPITSTRRSYTRERKIEVLKFLFHHKVVVTPSTVYQKPRVRCGMPLEPELVDPFNSITKYRLVTFEEASQFWKISKSILKRWWSEKEKILAGKASVYSPHWPELEKELFEQILTCQKASQIVTVGWIRRTTKNICKSQNPECVTLFTFSQGWFYRFQKQYNICRRRITKQAAKLPSEYIIYTNSFLQFIRQNSQLEKAKNPDNQQLSPFFNTVLVTSPPRRFPKAKILNMDKTPIPFEHLDGYSYDMTGARTVSRHTDQSRWNKHQATLILYIFADGIQRIKPKLIFYGTTRPSGQIYNKEKHLYHPGVTVEFNLTAYNNEELFMQWIDEELIPTANQNDTLLVMDVATFHKTDLILERLKSANITTALIPPGCTSFLQPLDTAVNGPFKQWLREESDQYMESIESEHPNFKWSTSDKRITTTHIVAKAAQRLEQEKREMVAQSFIQCGISIRPDGSEDSQIKVKDIPNTAIDFTGWESINFDVEYVKNELFKEVPEAVDNMEEVLVDEEV
ncbi:hypothetical protein B7463_g2199, partial [Scytalidium lignicola]